MTTTPQSARRQSRPAAYRPSAAKRAQVWLANHFAMLSAILVLLYLFLPVAYTFAFSFNDHGKTNIVWQGFTWKHWQNPCRVSGVCESLVVSLQVGVDRHGRGHGPRHADGAGDGALPASAARRPATC